MKLGASEILVVVAIHGKTHVQLDGESNPRGGGGLYLYGEKPKMQIHSPARLCRLARFTVGMRDSRLSSKYFKINFFFRLVHPAGYITLPKFIHIQRVIECRPYLNNSAGAGRVTEIYGGAKRPTRVTKLYRFAIVFDRARYTSEKAQGCVQSGDFQIFHPENGKLYKLFSRWLFNELYWALCSIQFIYCFCCECIVHFISYFYNSSFQFSN